MSYDRGDITGFEVGTTAIPAGVTLAILVRDPRYTTAGVLKYISGGSLLLMRAPGLVNGQYGATYAAATLANNYANGKYWLMDQAPFSYNGNASFYLAAIGATAVFQYCKGLDAGYSETDPVL